MEIIVLESIARWILMGMAVVPLILGIGWVIVEGVVLPRLVLAAEVERLAMDVMARHPDNPEEAAFVEEQAAWFRSETFDQAIWHRVRKVIHRSPG